METASSAGSSLAEALFGKSSRADEVWQEVRFDSPNAFLEARRGEVTLEALVRCTCKSPVLDRLQALQHPVAVFTVQLLVELGTTLASKPPIAGITACMHIGSRIK